MGLDSVVSRHMISTSNSDPQFGVRAYICDYLGLNEWISINEIK